MKRDFIRLLKELEEDELRDEMKMLYDRFPAIREYYKLELSANTGAVLEKYKKAVRKAFFTGRRRMNKRGRSASSRVIKDFSTVSIHPKDLVLLHLHRVAVMIEAIDYFYVENEPFHDSTVKSFRKALEMAQKESLMESVRPEAERLMGLFDDQKRLSWFTLTEVMREFYEV